LGGGAACRDVQGGKRKSPFFRPPTSPFFGLGKVASRPALTGSMIHTFKEGGQLLDDWRIVLEHLYPSRQDLLYMIPQLQALTLAKLANDGMVSTDTYNTACKTRCLLCKAIRTVAIEQGFREESINIMENDCWNHLHNVCFGAVIKELSSHLDEVLNDNLSEIHPILRVTTNPSNIFRAIEKFFG
jgi:hypothetical protein